MKAWWATFGFFFLAARIFAAEPSGPSVIPTPQKMEVRAGRFRLAADTRIKIDAASAETAEYLAAKLRAPTGFPFPIYTNDEPLKGVIELTTKGAKAELAPEGYELEVAPDGVSIKAPTQAGLFYGVQTLLQLLPPEIFTNSKVANVNWEIPFALHIEDRPRFAWRGFMLDCSRHFFSKDEVERVLNEMALHKLNMFHWHLTDDQGWRIEIKKYPKLTQIGAWRDQSLITPPDDKFGVLTNHVHPSWDVAPRTAYGPDGHYGGFYSQEDAREIVAYATSRHITVVPEIEMPGHAIAALAAYPELSCDGGSYSPNANAGVNKGVFCVGKDDVFTFLDNVLLEIFEVFPSQYVHVGGDEVNGAVKKATWGQSRDCQARMKAEGLKSLDELQGWFTGKIGKFVSEHGKTMIGWTEITEGPLPKNAIVMDWQGGAMAAAMSGHDVVMSPTKFCYFDYCQSLDSAMEPPGIGGYLPLEQVYSFEPIPADLPAPMQSHILGGQANLWTEYVPSLAHVEYMMFPRLCALAEVDWSPKSARNWGDFQQRLAVHEKRLDELSVNYRGELAAKIGDWNPAQLGPNASSTNTLEWEVSPEIGSAGQYRVTFERVSGPGLAITQVSLLQDGSEIAKDVHNGFAARHPTRPAYILNVPARKAEAKYTIRATVIGAGSTGMVTLLSQTNLGTTSP